MRRVGLGLGALLLLVIACGDDLLPSFSVLGDAGLLPDGFMLPDASFVPDAIIPDAPSGLPDGQPGPDGAMCTSDPRCPDLGTFCFDGDLIRCTLDGMGCRQVTGLEVCTAPRQCTGTPVIDEALAPGTSNCACPAPGSTVGLGCPALGAIGDCTGDPTYLECAAQNGCLVWENRTCATGVCNPGNVCAPPGPDAGIGPADAGMIVSDAGIVIGVMKK
jgi:hypothetical protein